MQALEADFVLKFAADFVLEISWAVGWESAAIGISCADGPRRPRRKVYVSSFKSEWENQWPE